MPSAPKRRGRPTHSDEANDETELTAKAAKQPRHSAASQVQAQARTRNRGRDADEEEEDSADSDSDKDTDESSSSEADKDVSETLEPETQWFNLEGCDPTMDDAVGVARLLRQFQLPTAARDTATALADCLIAQGNWRQLTSVVKQCLEDNGGSNAEEEEDDTVYSVVGVVDLADAGLRRLRNYLVSASPATKAALGDGKGSALGLLVKARAPELPAELALAQLEALQKELQQLRSSGQCPKRLLVLSPAWQIDGEASAGKEDDDSAVMDTVPVHAEDEILQSLADGPWEVLLASTAPTAGSSSSVSVEPSPRCHRVCVLETSQLGEAIERLRQSVGDRLRMA